MTDPKLIRRMEQMAPEAAAGLAKNPKVQDLALSPEASEALEAVRQTYEVAVLDHADEEWGEAVKGHEEATQRAVDAGVPTEMLPGADFKIERVEQEPAWMMLQPAPEQEQGYQP